MFSHTMLGICELQHAVDFYAPVLAWPDQKLA
jgi:hypothetical protein